MKVRAQANAGFTLAEAAVTIALVAVTLTVLLQSLENLSVVAVHQCRIKLRKKAKSRQKMPQIRSIVTHIASKPTIQARNILTGP